MIMKATGIDAIPPKTINAVIYLLSVMIHGWRPPFGQNKFVFATIEAEDEGWDGSRKASLTPPPPPPPPLRTPTSK